MLEVDGTYLIFSAFTTLENLIVSVFVRKASRAVS